jgi:hypothetical protein
VHGFVNRNPVCTFLLHIAVPSLLTGRLCGLVVRVSGYRYRGPGFDSRPYQIFWEVRDLEQGPLSLVRTIEELIEWKSSGSGLENSCRNLLRWPSNTLYPQRLALTLPPSGGRSVCIVRLRTKATELIFLSRLTMMFLTLFPEFDVGLGFMWTSWWWCGGGGIVCVKIDMACSPGTSNF